MEQQFRDWLVRRGNPNTTSSYPKAIHLISDHYSKATNVPTNIYTITDQLRISEIAHDYSQAGRFSKFGYEHHGRFRAAIARYSEYFSQPRNPEPSEPDPDRGTLTPGPQDPLQSSSNTFAYERDLQNALCAEISELFPDYRIFGDNLQGVEYPIEGRRIDVLLQHRTSESLLVVELKSGVADYRTFGQVCMYMGLLEAQFPNRPIRAVIVAGSIDSSLKSAAATSDRVALKVYRMSIELDDA